MSDTVFHWPWRAGEHAAAFEALAARSGGGCERCGGPGRKHGHYAALIVHHEQYAPQVSLTDLLLLCVSCHKKRHHEPDAPKQPPVTWRRKHRKTLEREAWFALTAQLGIRLPQFICMPKCGHTHRTAALKWAGLSAGLGNCRCSGAAVELLRPLMEADPNLTVSEAFGVLLAVPCEERTA